MFLKRVGSENALNHWANIVCSPYGIEAAWRCVQLWPKTQWMQWLALHNYGSYFYCKGSMEAMRHYNGEPCIIYDDIKVEKYPKTEWDDVFDCENGGIFAARYKDIMIPAGPKIWLQHPSVEVPDIQARIFFKERRCITRFVSKNLDITMDLVNDDE